MTMTKCGADYCRHTIDTRAAWAGQVVTPLDDPTEAPMIYACSSEHLHDAIAQHVRAHDEHAQALIDEADEPADDVPEYAFVVRIDGEEYVHAGSVALDHLEIGGGAGSWQLRTHGGEAGPMLLIGRAK